MLLTDELRKYLEVKLRVIEYKRRNNAIKRIPPERQYAEHC